ncbi:cilia- and flagella-associated protein 90 [Excalfactoria chinensis]|uniref:cilia- and flagella-associated protein 90 n=1 Tax=Excalfactoria chinensis TaxID=46218 RepID=UPI003B3A0796
MASSATAAAGEQEGDVEEDGSGLGRKRPPPVSSLSAFSYIPPRRECPAELSYFYRVAQTGGVSTYDSIFKRPEGYNEKLHRCDREHSRSRGLHVNDEETARPVAVLSSSEYGRRVSNHTEQMSRSHARVNCVQAEFYRKNGITCLLETPSPRLDP